MSDYSELELREVSPRFKISMRAVDELLASCGLKYEPLEYMVALFDDNSKALACGGYNGSTIKCVAVSFDMRGEGLSNKIISHLLQKMVSSGIEDISVFTKPENENMFSSFGFKIVEKADKAIFMERAISGIKEYADKLSVFKKDGINGCIVMNCNPFTLGHLHLVEYAAQKCDNLYVFVVSEDRSAFPFSVRLMLAQKNLEHLKNVTVLEGGKYIISNGVFPSYFLKEYSEVTNAHAQLDIRIFARYIAKALNIQRRFVGEEPTDAVTFEYNKVMNDILQEYGMEKPYIIPRKLDENGKIISASNVRSWLVEGDFEKIKGAVPKATYEFLTSLDSEYIIERIKNGYKTDI